MKSTYSSRSVSKGILLLLFCLLFSISSYAQEYTISGKVYDEVTGEVLPFANVFLAYTTSGVATDTTGYYSLKASGSGLHTVAVKYIGYEGYAKAIRLDKAREVVLDIYLSPTIYNTGAITVAAKGKKRNEIKTDSSTIVRGGQKWGRFLSLFRPLFIGRTDFSMSCKILNPEVLEFEVFEDRYFVKVRASEPLIVLNRALGYKIKYVLKNYQLFAGTERLIFEGYPQFEELKARNKNQAKRWEANRWEAYRGSYMHFFRSLYHNQLREEGFAAALYRIPDTTPVILEGLPFPKTDRRLEYVDLQSYLRPGIYTASKKLLVPSLLAVVASNNLEEEGYFRPAEHRDIFGGDSGYARRNLQRSWLQVHNKKMGIEIGPNGQVYNGLNFIMNGYWSFEKIGDMLPLDYRPGYNPAAIAD